MAQLALGDFKTEVKEGEVDSWASFRDSFDDLKFESGIIQQLNLNDEILFKFSQTLFCKRELDKKNKLEFRVFTNILYPDEATPGSGGCIEMVDCNKFKKKELAQEFFYNQKSHLEWNIEINKENKVFDGQRYIWKTENGELTGERGWL